MFESVGHLVRRSLRRFALLLVAGIGCVFILGPVSSAAAQGQAEYGYMLIRVILSSRERVEVLAMTNVETREAVRVREASFKQAGLNAWIALVPIPAGRYFLSEYEPKYGISTSENRSMAARQTRSDPGSDSNMFEIVAGVVNYVGDWTMRIDASRRMRFDPTVEFDKATLEMYLTEFPEQASEFEIYLSPLGEKAVSLNSLSQ